MYAVRIYEYYRIENKRINKNFHKKKSFSILIIDK